MRELVSDGITTRHTKEEPFSVASHPTSSSCACCGRGSLPILATWGTQCFSSNKVMAVEDGGGG